MNAAIAHRGERSSVEVFGGWTLGHVRLPIVGVGEEWDQPWTSDEAAFAYVGEIVNFRDLLPSAECDALLVAADLAGSRSMHAWDGFWSIAVATRGGAFLLTDPLAKRPLYVRREGAEVVAASSEIRSLLELGPVDPDELYFSSVCKWGYHVGDRTFALQVRKVPPFTCFSLSDPSQTHAYGRLDMSKEDDGPEGLRRSVERAVASRTTSSDVPVAVLASGGLDSTIVAILARRFADVTLIHVDNDEREFVDLLPGPKIAATLGDVDPDDAMWTNEGPVDLGSVKPQIALARAARDAGFKVVLSGDGADELFGGYSRARTYDSQASDVFEELIHYHLPRLDRAMSSATVELRCPFLSTGVVARALATPRAERVDKWRLKEAFADVVPKEILARGKKPLRTEKDDLERRVARVDRFRAMCEERGLWKTRKNSSSTRSCGRPI